MPTELTPAALEPADHFGIVVAKWNEGITRKLLDGAVSTLREHGVKDEAIEVAWVPGSFEIPLIAQRMAASNRCAAVICLGAVIRGETTHDQHINRAVSTAICQIALDTGVPVLFGVLTCDTVESALDRCGLPGSHEDKGWEAVVAALDTALVLRSIRAAHQPV